MTEQQPRSGAARCLRRDCPYLRHRDKQHGYCCDYCQQKRGHGPLCQHQVASSGASYSRQTAHAQPSYLRETQWHRAARGRAGSTTAAQSLWKARSREAAAEPRELAAHASAVQPGGRPGESAATSQKTRRAAGPAAQDTGVAFTEAASTNLDRAADQAAGQSAFEAGKPAVAHALARGAAGHAGDQALAGGASGQVAAQAAAGTAAGQAAGLGAAGTAGGQTAGQAAADATISRVAGDAGDQMPGGDAVAQDAGLAAGPSLDHAPGEACRTGTVDTRPAVGPPDDCATANTVSDKNAEPAAADMGKRTRPNVIWFLGDQLRAQAARSVGPNADPNVHTPNLEKLAAEGMDFVNAVSGYPLCCPFRGSLLTSKYPHQCVAGHEVPLPPDLDTVVDPFRETGYKTAYFGKWHLDGYKERDGNPVTHKVPREHRAGFDTWIAYENNNLPDHCRVHGHDEDEERAFELLEKFETNALTDRLIKYAEQRAQDGQPFFAVLSVQPPHDPYEPTRPMLESWQRRQGEKPLKLRKNVLDYPGVKERVHRELPGYYALIENLDENLGKLVDALKDFKLWGNTHVIFFSDHGDMHGSHGCFGKTRPWEESIRIPFVVGGAAALAVQHGKCKAVLNHVDVAPTTLGLCGIKPPASMRGYDYSHHRIRGRAPPAQPEPTAALLQLVQPTGYADSAEVAWRGIVTTTHWKYVVKGNAKEGGLPWLLFELNEDRYELNNLVDRPAYRGKLKDLHERLRQKLREEGDDYVLQPANGPRAAPRGKVQEQVAAFEAHCRNGDRCARAGCTFMRHTNQLHGYCCNDCREQGSGSHGPLCEQRRASCIDGDGKASLLRAKHYCSQEFPAFTGRKLRA